MTTTTRRSASETTAETQQGSAHGWWRAPHAVRQVLLAVLTLATGAVDALSWLMLGKVFSAFMTGNLVFLGLLAGGAQGPDTTHVAVAIAAFAVGAAIGGRVTASVRNQEQWWPLQVSVALGCTAVLEAGALGVWATSDAHPSGTTVAAIVGLFAMSMGIQTVAIASLGVRGIFTTAATATLAILMGDTAGWAHVKGEAPRLISIVVALVAGAAIGGLLVEQAPLWAPLVPVCLTLLVVAGAELLLGDRSLSVELPES